MTSNVETHTFQAETRQLLDLMIHSLYSHKEIFLRELISNASDALDRLRFEALTHPELLGGDEELEIRLETDPKARTLSVHDNGIGMSREEVVANIGTIAKSGTRELMEKIRGTQEDQKIAELIGQFGVGFYSSFMVADRVVLLTRRGGDEEATRWESSGDGEYTLAATERARRGTSVTLHLKAVDEEAGLSDFTDRWVLERVVKQYSDFVTFPIVLPVPRAEEKDDDKKEEEAAQAETALEDKRLNSMTPVWSSSEAKEEDYNEFYKHISHDWNDPLLSLPFRAEGRFEYQALLFIPAQAPFDLFYTSSAPGLQLYVRRVRIMERCEDLLPNYFRFVKGVVESPDLPLNVSREMLQHDRNIAQIQKGLVKKVLDRLKELAEEDPDKYLTFWNQFGRAIKEGVGLDYANREKLLPLLRFESTHDPEKLTSLKDYVARMKEGQDTVYYLTGESRKVVENSPHLESLKEKGYEVLFFIDPVDELMVQSLNEVEGKKLKSAGKGTVDLDDEEAQAGVKEREAALKPLFEKLQGILDREIKEVRVSHRLTQSPVCLVGAEHDYSPQLEKLLQKGKGGGAQQRWILELNPKHDILQRLEERFQKDPDDPAIVDGAHLLLGYAYLAEGVELTDPVDFNRRLAGMMSRSL